MSDELRRVDLIPYQTVFNSIFNWPFQREKSVGEGMEFRENVHQAEAAHSFIWVLSGGILVVPWVLGSVCVLGSGSLSRKHKGSDTIFSACSPPEAQRWDCWWSPGVRVGPTFSSWNNSFLHTLIMRIISYHLKLKFSYIWVPHHVYFCRTILLCLPYPLWHFPAVIFLTFPEYSVLL